MFVSVPDAAISPQAVATRKHSRQISQELLSEVTHGAATMSNAGESSDWYQSARAISDLTLAGADQSECKHFSRLPFTTFTRSGAFCALTFYIALHFWVSAHRIIRPFYDVSYSYARAPYARTHTTALIWHMHNTTILTCASPFINIRRRQRCRVALDDPKFSVLVHLVNLNVFNSMYGCRKSSK